MVVNDIAALATAGFKADIAWLNEKTGYKLTDAPLEKVTVRADEKPPGDASAELTAENAKGAEKNPQIKNRASHPQDASTQTLAKTLHETLLPILKRLDAIAKVDDTAIQQHMIEKLLKDFPQIAEAIQADDSLAKKLSPVLETALLQGMTNNKDAKAQS